MRNFVFRKLTREDLPLLRSWLNAPHVKAWWPDAETRIGAMLNDLYSAAINMQLVCLINHPFAYIQDFDARAYGQSEFIDLPARARVLETFIGDANFMGQGHASGYLDARVRELRMHYPVVAVGPNTKDTHAIHIYNQAGFQKRRLCAARDGRLIQVMTHL